MRAPVTIVRPVAAVSLAGFLFLLASPAHAAGMPQLEFKNPLIIGQVIWGAGIFLIFYLLLRGWALPRVGKVLEDRHARISGDLDVARAAKAEADKAVAELLLARQKAAAEAQAHLDRVLDEERAAAAARLNEMNTHLAGEIAIAEKGVAEERARAMQSLHSIASETASSLVERLTGARPDAAQLDAAVSTAAAEFARQGKMPA